MAFINFCIPEPSSITTRRRHGFSLPLYYVQVIALILIVFIVLMHYLTSCVNIPTHPWQWLVIVLSSLLIVPFLVVFMVVSCRDPAEDEVIRKSSRPRADFDRRQHSHVITDLYCNICDVHVTNNAKHCSNCNKCIYDFDHHCIWLNTCIGGKNYRLFLTMLTLIVFGTLLMFINSLLQFIGTFDNSTTPISLKPYYPPDQYAILMIPSSLVAFQVMTFIMGTLNIVACGLTGYLLLFHMYLCYYSLSTYDYVLRRRTNQMVEQTTSHFNQLRGNSRQESMAEEKKTKSFSKSRRRSNQIADSRENGKMNHSKLHDNSEIFTVEKNYNDSSRRLQGCQNSPREVYALKTRSTDD